MSDEQQIQSNREKLISRPMWGWARISLIHEFIAWESSGKWSILGCFSSKNQDVSVQVWHLRQHWLLTVFWDKLASRTGYVGIEAPCSCGDLTVECICCLREQHDLPKKNYWGLIVGALEDPLTPIEFGGSPGYQVLPKPQSYCSRWTLQKRSQIWFRYYFNLPHPQFSYK